MMRSLRDLQAIVVLADEKHFGRAADRLAMSQPQLSALISRIEDTAGLRLFVRRPNVRVTDEGAPLVHAASTALEELSRGLKHAQQLSAGAEGLIRVAYVASAMLTELPLAFRSFRYTYPNVRFDFTETNSRGAATLVESGSCDLAFTREPASLSGLTSEPLFTEPFVAISAASAGRGRDFDPAAFAAQPLILFPNHSAPLFREQILAVCAHLGMAGDVSQIANGWPAALAMVQAGLGVTVGPSCLRKFSFTGVRFDDLPRAAGVSTLWLLEPSREIGKAAREFAKLLRAN